MANVVGAFVGGEFVVEELSDSAPEIFSCSFRCFAEQCFELSKEVLDRVEVGGVRGQEQEFGTRCFDQG